MISIHKFYGLLIAFVFNSVFLFSQNNWQAVQCYDANASVRYVLYDSINNEISINQTWDFNICNITFKGNVAYNGLNFHSLNKGINTHDTLNNVNSSIGILACVPYMGKTLYGGLFSSVGNPSIQAEAMALWDGNKWSSFDGIPFKYNPIGNNSKFVYGFFNDGGKLWIYGQFDSIANKPAQNLAYFDGINYYPVNIPVSWNYNVTNAIKYKNEMYFSGGFKNYPINNNNFIIRYNNGSWSTVGSGVKTSLGAIHSLAIYNDTLYIGGEYSKTDGNYGNYLMKWDGKNLTDAGFGNFNDWGGIRKLLVFNNKLYAFGRFKYAANQKAFGAAFYENGKWTTNKDSINGVILSASILNNEIYVGGSFTNMNSNDSIKYLAKLKCPNFDNCKNQNQSIVYLDKPYPNPFSNELNLILKDNTNCTLTVFNTLGQQLIKLNATSSIKINTSNWDAGVYIMYINNNYFNKTFKMIKQ